MPITVITDSITFEKLRKIAKEQFGDLAKAVVDVGQEIMAVGGELHSDEEVFLAEKHGSKREHTWGINLYPDKAGSNDFIEFDSVINLKPSQGNRSRGVEDVAIQQKIRNVVEKLIN